jgi:hypothetical protein
MSEVFMTNHGFRMVDYEPEPKKKRRLRTGLHVVAHEEKRRIKISS